jgi:hypothetical protein
MANRYGEAALMAARRSPLPMPLWWRGGKAQWKSSTPPVPRHGRRAARAELSVIRQPRDTNEYGQYRKKPAVRRPGGAKLLKSAFDDQESYVLTALGKQFLHYTMSEILTRITAESGPAKE